MEDRAFERWFYKVPRTYGDGDDPRVHLGIPRTGSSTIRALIRNHCLTVGEGLVEHGDDNRLIDRRHRYVISPTPYPMHRETSRTCLYFTSLRNPVEALLSLYYWQRGLGST